jgi:hypothetical protein
MLNLLQLFENTSALASSTVAGGPLLPSSSFSILSYIMITPLIGILLLLFLRENEQERSHKIALYTSLITFILSIFL